MLADPLHVSYIDQYVDHPRWAMQYKADGIRYLITVQDGHVHSVGRNGQTMTGLTKETLAVLRTLPGTWQLDGELLPGKKLVLFDVVRANELISPKSPYSDRMVALQLVQKHTGIDVLSTAVTPDEKRAMFECAVAEQREGVILRALDAPYLYGKRDARYLKKVKFIKEADCHLTALGVGTSQGKYTNGSAKDNAELTLYDDAGQPHSVGKASTIGKRPTPKVGDVWEVHFLYCVDKINPRLVQPRLVRVRKDKDPQECSLHQLDTCFTNKELAA